MAGEYLEKALREIEAGPSAPYDDGSLFAPIDSVDEFVAIGRAFIVEFLGDAKHSDRDDESYRLCCRAEIWLSVAHRMIESRAKANGSPPAIESFFPPGASSLSTDGGEG